MADHLPKTGMDFDSSLDHLQQLIEESRRSLARMDEHIASLRSRFGPAMDERFTRDQSLRSTPKRLVSSAEDVNSEMNA